MRLILVRHGETDWNQQYRIQGQSDLPLNECGMAQAKSIALALKDERVEAIYSSPLRRALGTAEAINRFHQVKLVPLDELKELDVGELDGMHGTDLRIIYPAFFRDWVTDAASTRLPGGESLTELQDRAWDAVEGVLERNQSDLIVVSHFFVIISLLCKVLNLHLSEFRRFGITVGSISILEFNGKRTEMVSFNDTCHLE